MEVNIICSSPSEKCMRFYAKLAEVHRLKIETINAVCLEDFELAAKCRDEYIEAGGSVGDLRRADLAYRMWDGN